MPLTLPKQQITGNLGINNVSGSVTLPMQSVTAVAVMPFLSGTVGIPTQQISGAMAMPGLFVDVTIPMQQVTATAESFAVESVLTVPMQRISGLEPEITEAIVSVPMQQVAVWMEQPILGIPMQQITASATVPLVIESALITIPMQLIPSYQTGDMVGSAPTITGLASIINSYTMAAAIPAAQSSMDAVIGASASMSGSLPVVLSTASVYVPASMDGTIVTFTGVASGVTGSVSSIASIAPAFTASAAAVVGIGASMNASAPLLHGAMAGDATDTATMSGCMHPPASSAQASVGIACMVESTGPGSAQSSLQIWVRPEMAMNSESPSMRGVMSAQVLAQSVSILSMNLKNGAVSEFSSLIDMDSVASIDGMVYVGGADGLFVMDSTQDNGEDFTQSVALGFLDFSSPGIKVPESCLMNADADSATLNMKSESASYSYEFAGPKRGDMYRAKVGRGIDRNQIQFEITGTGIRRIDSLDFGIKAGKRTF